MFLAATSAETGWVMFALAICLLVAFGVYHVSRSAPLGIPPGQALLAAGAAGGVSVPIVFQILEKLTLLA
ncbi:hypothetical protein OHA37_40655 (plasmid) [Streptomyces sp. NBC_00335]|uniref:hypothetical protein n=1 Tax=unclassified Streptomyces TaxID=2593676 RepID=UPI002251D600|nr:MULTISPECIES: hypothetical protein [unclassified Streptomyces]MCX5410140.1 hypothetical protein [Streptomyces sp. NBC_00086]